MTMKLCESWIYSTAVFGVAVAGLLAGTMFAVWNGFVETELLPKRYSLVVATALLAIVLACQRVVRFKMGLATGAVCCVMAYFVVRTFLSPLEQPVIVWVSVAALLLLYVCFNAMPQRWDVILEGLVILVCVAQGIYGILQYAGLVPPRSTFPVVGCFDNPAGFAACLAAGFPFCLKKLPKGKCWQWGLVMCGRVVIPVAIVMSGSRAGMLSIVLVSAVCLYDKYSRIRKPLIATAIFVAGVLLLAAMFFLKTGSSLGRLQIWEASIAMVGEHPLFGGGAGLFLANYMPHQAAFFAADPSKGWPLLADNVAHPFNEYLLILIEYGIAGLSLLLFAAFVMLRNRRWSTTQGLCLLAIGVFACFSYPLRYPFVWVVIAYAMATIGTGRCVTMVTDWKMRTTAIGMIILICGLSFYDSKFELKWGNAVRTWNIGNPEASLEIYRQLYSRWNGNPFFLYNYGRVLGAFGRHCDSNRILTRCCKYLNDYDAQMAIGDNYRHIGESDKACQCYHTASLMCPNRFLPLYRLMTFYAESGQVLMARAKAQQILKMPVKIPSPRISQIQEEAKQLVL